MGMLQSRMQTNRKRVATRARAPDTDAFQPGSRHAKIAPEIPMDVPPPALVVTLCGRVALWSDGVEHQLSGRHPRLLLALLATERSRSVPRDELADALWGEAVPESWQASLRVSLSKLRAFLVAAGLERASLMSSGAGGYQLELGSRVEIDVERARSNLEVAERSLAAGDLVVACEASAAARVVLAAPLVPGADGPWIEDRRRAARRLLVRALEVEAEARAARGESGRAVAAAQEAVALEPFEESAHRALMRAHAAGGNKAQALRSYERCRQLLSAELGIDPSPATEAVYLKVVKDETVLPAAISTRPVMLEEGGAGRLETARTAVANRRWLEAFRLLSDADVEQPLAVEDLELLGESAFWSGKHAAAVAARERAYAAHLEAGERRAAAAVALALVSNFAVRSQLAVAGGWFETAARLLADEPEGPEHGFLAFSASAVSLDTGDLGGSLEQAKRAFDIGQRYGFADLEALGLTFQGLVFVCQDMPREALALLDEAMALATSGRVSPLSAGLIYCRSIRTWLDLFDFRRASEWIETVEQCAFDTGFGGYSGDCDAHRAVALMARGSWVEAQRAAERACEECDSFELSHVGLASYTLGELCLRRGDLTAAAAAFRRANEHGVVPQPGLALLQMARRDATGALASVKACLESMSAPLMRAWVLPAAVEIAIAAGDVEWAHVTADELSGIAETYQSVALSAAAARGRGAVHLTDPHHSEAVRHLRGAVDAFRRVEMPYELARTRVLLARALLSEGDRAGASMELESALALFDRLGAGPDAGAARRFVEELQSMAASDPLGW